MGPFILSEPELVAWGERIGAEAAVPLVLALRGELGAGKSVFARAVARGAGVSGPMPSPTFNLVFGYHGRRGVDVWHLDLYRLEDEDDVWELGWQELGEDADIVLIEWPERAEALLPRDRWDIVFEFGKGKGRGKGRGKGKVEGKVEGEGEERVVRLRRCGAAPMLPPPPDERVSRRRPGAV